MIALELMFVLGLVAVFLLCVWAVVYTGVWARKRGRRTWIWRSLVGFALYLIFAWEQIPTLVVGEYLCSEYSGLKVYEVPYPKIDTTSGFGLVSGGARFAREYITDAYFYVKLDRWVDLVPVHVIGRYIVKRETGEVAASLISLKGGARVLGG